eukprot:TRINITY_DN5221_c0_g1_i1.p3 TRINITY_DN5221_c0_g1~~TRINITY_DN5221_c0_g1_i1.p3  ORF type:complete len:195 (+),score=60.54 TRINITY_DN5221_c0_g1_i1:65-649(+)
MSAAEWYGLGLQVCQQWSQHCMSTPLDQVLQHFPPASAPPAMDVQTLAVVVCEVTQGRLTGEAKLQQFRIELQRHLAQSLPASVMNQPTTEPWHGKDLFQLLCELLLVQDISRLQQEVIAALVEAVIVFGRDATTVIAFLLCMRARYAWGRATQVEESKWLAEIGVKAIRRGEEYLASEHVGELQLAQIVAGVA